MPEYKTLKIMSVGSADEKVIYLFWTGGFDSTCRVVQLSRLDVTVQPFYLVDGRYRRSVGYELKAISEILPEIVGHPETRFRIKPLIRVDVSSLKPYPDIKEAHRKIREEIALGMQYEWLAAFAREHPGTEISFEKAEGGHIYNYFRKHGVLCRVDEGQVSYLEFDKSQSESILFAVFGNFHFPLPIIEKTKFELIDEYKRLGFENIMCKTWFCHNPVRGEPCGVCNPCKIVIEDGLSFRMPGTSMKRNAYETKHGARTWFKIWKKIRWRVFRY